jgi:ubiquinone/menaquinone biosynthesis C-methylase UbiE
MDSRAHWESVYQAKRADEVSWFQREPAVSRELIQRVAPDRSSRIIDVGGGASTLVDALLATGYEALTVLDIADGALAQARVRLGERAGRVQWMAGDVRTIDLPAAAFDVWHDRAVFHFLTDARDRAAYAGQLRRAVRPGGHAIVATFAEDGPERCSGLPVVRYSPEALRLEFGEPFRLIDSVRELHTTPSGSSQSFVYCLFRTTDHSM